MNAPESDVKFVPKQALAPTPQLYDELVGDSMERLAKASLADIPPLTSGSIVHDNGCGTGAGSAAILELTSPEVEVTIKATDIDESAVRAYEARALDNNWPAAALKMDAQKLTFADNTFSLSIGNGLIFAIPNDGIDAVKEMHRTLKPGGTRKFILFYYLRGLSIQNVNPLGFQIIEIREYWYSAYLVLVNCWAYIPNIEALRIASQATRPLGSPPLRNGVEKWYDPDFIIDIVEEGGFAKDNINVKKADVYCTVSDLTAFATMLWSFIGGTSQAGWLENDEEHWDKAVEIIKQELRKSDGFEALEGEEVKLKFVANIAIATK